MKVLVEQGEDGLRVRIPPEVAAASKLSPGTALEVSVSGGCVVLAPEQVPTLQELVSGITPENRHEEIDFGPPVGKEVW